MDCCGLSSTGLNDVDANNITVTDTLGQVNTTVNTIVGGVGALAALASYYSNLQLTLAVTSGVVVGTGLLLAFTLKEDRLDVKAPLSKRAPIAGSGEYFNQIELKFNPTLLLDNGILSVNTREFLTPLWGDLALIPTPANITTSSYHMLQLNSYHNL